MNRVKFISRDGNADISGSPILVSVLSGKGGVGKSVLSFNIAEQTASRGHKVLLVDADTSCGSLRVMANVQEDFGFQQFASGQLSLAESVTSINSNFDVLPGASAGVAVDPVTVAEAAQIATSLRSQGSRYDMIMIDHGSGISKPATVMAHASDINILVVIPELTSISDGYGLYKYLNQMDAKLDCRLLLNRVESASEADYIRGKFLAITERFLGHVPGYLGAITESDTVKKAVARQVPMSTVDNQSVVSQAVNRISQILIGHTGFTAVRPKTASKKTINKTPATADIEG